MSNTVSGKSRSQPSAPVAPERPVKVTTSRFGQIEVNPLDIIEFPDGMLGFEDCKRFVVLNPSAGSPFRWLQCLDEAGLAFVITEPLNFLFEYDLEISDSDTEFLGLTRAEEVLIYVIVTIPEDPHRMTANLQGPLVINVSNRRGRQVVSTHPEHRLKAVIVDEMAKREAKLAEVKRSLDGAAAAPDATPAAGEPAAPRGAAGKRPGHPHRGEGKR